MRILVVKMSSMGDVVHAQPVATDLRRVFPDARVEWVVEKSFAAICRLNPAIDEVIPISWRRWRKSLFSPAVRTARHAGGMHGEYRQNQEHAEHPRTIEQGQPQAGLALQGGHSEVVGGVAHHAHTTLIYRSASLEW